MNHPEPVDIIAFEIVGDYTLHLTFDDHTTKVINFEPILFGPIFGPLRDLEFFNQVALNEEIGTIVWPNEADFDPSNLYYWEENEAAFIKRGQRWQQEDVKV